MYMQKQCAFINISYVYVHVTVYTIYTTKCTGTYFLLLVHFKVKKNNIILFPSLHSMFCIETLKSGRFQKYVLYIGFDSSNLFLRDTGAHQQQKPGIEIIDHHISGEWASKQKNYKNVQVSYLHLLFKAYGRKVNILSKMKFEDFIYFS